MRAPFWMWTFVKTVLALAATLAIVPLMVWAGSGSWRHAAHALRGYLIALGLLAALGGGLGLVMVLAEFTNR